MPLDPMIAGGFRGIELQNPLEAYGRIAQIQNMQQQNALNALQMQKAQRDLEVENRLAQLYARPGADVTSPDFLREAYSISPVRGAAIQKSSIELEKERRLAEAAAEDLASKRIASARAVLPSITPDTWPAWRADTIKKLPGLAGMIPEAYSDEARLRLMQNADQFLAERGKRTVVAPGATVLGAEGTPIFTAPDKSKLLSPEEEAQRIRIAKESRPVTNVQLPPQEKAEKGERGKMLVKDFESIKQSASIAARTMPAIDSNLAILDKGFDTGFGTEAKASAAKVLSALGVKDAEKYAANAETFLANATQGVLQRQLEQKGPQTEADAQRITQTGAQLGNTKQGNRFLLTVAKAQLKRDIDQRNFYADWYKKNGTYDGAEDAWVSGEGGKSLFDRPELKSFADMTPTPTAAGRARPSLNQIFGR